MVFVTLPLASNISIPTSVILTRPFEPFIVRPFVVSEAFPFASNILTEPAVIDVWLVDSDVSFTTTKLS